jgi:hypothetical protein
MSYFYRIEAAQDSTIASKHCIVVEPMPARNISRQRRGGPIPGCQYRPGSVWSMIPKSGYRFSEKIMLHQ